MKKEKLEKLTTVKLPFDLRNSDPKKNYGVHGLDIWFILKGKKGAVQFMVNFPVYLPHVTKEGIEKGWFGLRAIVGVDVGYHAKKPQFDGQKAMDCEMFGKCFYDGSGFAAYDWAKEIFSVRGETPEKLLWEKLEKEYCLRFGK